MKYLASVILGAALGFLGGCDSSFFDTGVASDTGDDGGSSPLAEEVIGTTGGSFATGGGVP